MGERLKILLSGMVAGDPHQGGATWAALQYFVGLQELGHEVILVEPVKLKDEDFDSCGENSEIVRYFNSLLSLGGRAALFMEGTENTVGLSFKEIATFASDADLLINISGMLRDERLLEPIPVRTFLDLDPGFNQVWHLTGEDMGLDLHTHFVTVGQAIGSDDCPIPTCGRSWIPTLPPVVLNQWPHATESPEGVFTTVGHWRSYGSINYGGIHYGQRAHSLRALMEMPRRVDERFELALGIHPNETGDLEALRCNGWKLVDPIKVAGTPGRYASFIRASCAELGIAKSGYVASRSGWFSDRSACYLASGRPVVAQETGFSDFLLTGEGLLVFSTLDEAVAAIEEVRQGWRHHSERAREFATEHFDARKVLAQLLSELASPPDSPSHECID
jgi:hypothetical protein